MYGPLHDSYVAQMEKGMRPTMARLTLARKIAPVTLTMWKKAEWVSIHKTCSGKQLDHIRGRRLPVPGILSGGGRSDSGDARFEGEYQSMRSGGLENQHVR
jgi:hypothetical protein